MPKDTEKNRRGEESSKEKELLSPDDGAAPAKGRGGLLHVPSRSSSQRIEPSPTSTGLSGATARDPRESIDGHSKESQGSMLGRHRNGSAVSNHSGIGTGPTSTPENSQPNSPAAATHNKKKKKSGGIMALFNCCGVPDHANDLDADDQPSHRVEKLNPRPATASRRAATPSEQPTSSRTHLYEKEPLQQSQNTPENNHRSGKRVSGASTQDQSTVGERDAESKQTTLVGSSAPQVTVEPPHSANSRTAADQADGATADGDNDGDVNMPDAEASSRQQAKQPASGADENYVPPPPPGPIPAVPNAPGSQVSEGVMPFAPEQPQKFLLPVQAPEFKGKKCLVLDLDETLVHSSFKVSAESSKH